MASTWRASFAPIDTWSRRSPRSGWGIDGGRHRAAGEVVDDSRGGVLHDHETRFGAVLVADQEAGRPSLVARSTSLLRRRSEIDASTGIAALT